MSLSSLVLSCLALLLLAFACSAQTPGACGITSIGDNDYDFSGIGPVKIGINPADQNWAYTVCDASDTCEPPGETDYTACTGSSFQVPLALVGDPVQWSFVDAQRPQLGVLAQYPLTQDPDDSALFRQLTVLFACGPDTVEPGDPGAGLAALESVTVVSATSTVAQYTFTVPTSIVCSHIDSNVHGNFSKASSNFSKVASK